MRLEIESTSKWSKFGVGNVLAGTSSRGPESRFAAEFLDEVRDEGVLGHHHPVRRPELTI